MNRKVRLKFTITLAFLSVLALVAGSTATHCEVDDEFPALNQPYQVTSSDSFDHPVQEVFFPVDSANSIFDDVVVPPETQPAARPYPLFNRQLKWAMIAISASIIAGILVRFKTTRKLRSLFLLASLVILGFYNGACPCPIQSLMNIIRITVGKTVRWQNLIYFLGLIPVTYLFGKVWCGWVCHMGALQEFLFLPSRFNLLRSPEAQRVMRIMRYILLVALIVWVAVRKFAVWCLYDPFRVAFNLSSHNMTGWILLALLLLSSLFVYRPFCRAFCPIGLILGWITKLPGASVIGLGGQCSSCMSCEKDCRIDAIIQKGCVFVLDNQECIACGDCIDACNPGVLRFFRKGKGGAQDTFTCSCNRKSKNLFHRIR